MTLKNPGKGNDATAPHKRDLRYQLKRHIRIGFITEDTTLGKLRQTAFKVSGKSFQLRRTICTSAAPSNIFTKQPLFNFDLHYFTGVTAFSHCLFTPFFSENVTMLGFNQRPILLI